METRANYVLIGLFTLGVIAAAFLFVLWFSGGEKQSSRQTYRIVFTGSVAGLSRGNAVLFNGVRIGEVSRIDLIPDDPAHVAALVDIDARVPVHTDTKARLEYTGFTGVASVALTGGAEDTAPLKRGEDGQPATIYADRSDFQDLIETTRRVATQASDFLGKANTFLDANSESLSTSIKNVEKFSDALAANSDGLKQLFAALSDIGKSIKPLTAKLETLASDADNVVRAVDPDQVKSIMNDFAGLSKKLNNAADKVDGVLTSLNGFFATSDSKGAFAEVSDAAKSIRRLADHLDVQLKEIAGNVNRFAGSGLRQYEALAVDGRKTLETINQAVRSIEANPTQFLFGKKSTIPEYNGSR